MTVRNCLDSTLKYKNAAGGAASRRRLRGDSFVLRNTLRAPAQMRAEERRKGKGDVELAVAMACLHGRTGGCCCCCSAGLFTSSRLLRVCDLDRRLFLFDFFFSLLLASRSRIGLLLLAGLGFLGGGSLLATCFLLLLLALLLARTT